MSIGIAMTAERNPLPNWPNTSEDISMRNESAIVELWRVLLQEELIGVME